MLILAKIYVTVTFNEAGSKRVYLKINFHPHSSYCACDAVYPPLK
jgi:hypothetical protein